MAVSAASNTVSAVVFVCVHLFLRDTFAGFLAVFPEFFSFSCLCSCSGVLVPVSTVFLGGGVFFAFSCLAGLSVAFFCLAGLIVAVFFFIVLVFVFVFAVVFAGFVEFFKSFLLFKSASRVSDHVDQGVIFFWKAA